VLWALGLRQGQGADTVLLNDPGPWSKVWRVLVDPEGCRRVASIIRGWVGEDARELWERLRAEPVPEDEGEAAARWCWLQTKHHNGIEVGVDGARFLATSYKADAAATHQNRAVRTAAKQRAVDMGAAIREARERLGLSRADVSEAVMGKRTGACWNWEHGQPVSADVWPRLRGVLSMSSEWDAVVEHVERVDIPIDNPGDWTVNVPDAEDIAPRFGSLHFPPATLVLGEDAAGIEPREVARWCWVQGHANRTGTQLSPQYDGVERANWNSAPPTEWIAREVVNTPPFPPTAVSNLDAADIHPEPPLPEGTVVMIDPPYFGDGSRKITGYQHEFPRASVVEVALRWKAAGARVAVCECVAVPELVAEGWHALDITGTRIGQKRTFSAAQSEWLTLSHPPEWTPPEQGDLFA